MTTEQTLEPSKTCGFDEFTGEERNCWECCEEQLSEFALTTHENGYSNGYGDGVNSV
jgi:hypothetical protein